MNELADLLGFAVIASTVVTALVLIAGLMTFWVGEADRGRFGHRMMRWRVGMQGLTLALIALYFAVSAAA